MLKQSYNAESEIPDNLKGAYVQSGDKWILDQLSTDHPVLLHNTKLLTEKAAVEAQVVNLKTEVETAKAEAVAAKAKGLPHAHEAVPKADAELARIVKAAGITKPEEFTAMKDEHATFKTKVAAQERREHLDAVRKAEGWGESAVDVLSLIQDLPDVELRDTEEKDEKGVPKKKAIAKVKGADNVVTEKPFSEYFAAKHSALLPSVQAVKQADGTPLPSHGAGGGGGETDLIAARNKARDAARSANPNPLMPKAAVAA